MHDRIPHRLTIARSANSPCRPLRVMAVLLGLFIASSGVSAEVRTLADAVEKRDQDVISKLLASKVDVNAAQPDGMTALHWAALHDDADLVAALLKNKAAADQETRYGVRPLALACRNGNDRIVKLLLDAGADPHRALAGGETPLMTAARTGNAKAVRLLIERGAKVDAKDRKGQTALMWAAAEGNLDAVDELIRAGADVRAAVSTGFTPLFFAIREGRTAVSMRLLAAGVDVNEPLNPGGAIKKPTNALLLAIENGHFDLAAELLKAGARPDDKPAGYTALHAMSWVRKPLRGDGDPPPPGSGRMTSLEMVRQLVASGAEVNARLEKGLSGRGRLTTTGATPFFLAARASDLPLMQLLADLGADPTLTNGDGSTPLMAAAGVGALDDGDEAAATDDETLAALTWLLERGADINAVDRNGETAMHGAAYQDRPKTVRFLAARGADITQWNTDNKWGWTPWRIAEGHRPGNFRPAPATMEALKEVMEARGVTPPPPKARDARVRYSDG
jgi:uncharacterized protein